MKALGILNLRRLWLVLMSVMLLHASIVMAGNLIVPDQIEGATRVTAEDVINLVMLEPEVVIIDSRKQQPFDDGHIQDAVNILDSKMTENSLADMVPNKSTPVVFYCNGETCLRSANAATKAYHWGYSRVYWFRGGWKEWVDKEMPVSRVKK
ncbi:MAG: rhodanese-like domain-containing protein [Gammaproteobacteria bacterium]|nr:rhodanese-like domain-containing protein [Gammaproteobacteria bacterium]MDH5735460.1 rhodanese-like domain-containing protein [Gammaproteobacteria bacterium]